jgi:hypothetical protein
MLSRVLQTKLKWSALKDFQALTQLDTYSKAYDVFIQYRKQYKKLYIEQTPSNITDTMLKRRGILWLRKLWKKMVPGGRNS